MGHTEGFKKAVVQKLLMPNSIGINALSREVGINRRTIYDWRETYRNDILNDNKDHELLPEDWPFEAKYDAVIESKRISDENLGEWLRTNGIRTEHLEKWGEELKDMAKNKDNNDELKKANKRIKELEKELRIKDKALSEAAALLLLKKKLEVLWENEEER
jgi:transposase-like protein